MKLMKQLLLTTSNWRLLRFYRLSLIYVLLFVMIVIVGCEQNVPLEGYLTKQFSAEYNCNNYEIELGFYTSLYDYHHSKKKKVFSYKDNDDISSRYYLMFLKSTYDDDLLSNLIREVGDATQTQGDELVQALVQFVQQLEYNCKKYRSYLGYELEEYTTNYPYETLYLGGGVCEDSSILLTKILTKMGYGSALLEFNEENHMAVGINCPRPDYGAYCYIETTSPKRIGVKPILSGSVPLVSKPKIIVVGEGKDFVKIIDIKEKQLLLEEEYGSEIVNISTCEGVSLFNDTFQTRQIVDKMEIVKAEYEDKLEIYSQNIEELKEKYNDDLTEYDNGGCLEVIRSQTKYDLCLIMYNRMNSSLTELNKEIEENNDLFAKYNEFYTNYTLKYEEYNQTIQAFNVYARDKSDCLTNWKTI